MYNRIRGQGLTYGVSLSGSVTEGRIRLKFSRSSQLDLAYEVFREIVQVGITICQTKSGEY